MGVGRWLKGGPCVCCAAGGCCCSACQEGVFVIKEGAVASELILRVNSAGTAPADSVRMAWSSSRKGVYHACLVRGGSGASESTLRVHYAAATPAGSQEDVSP